jgi:hypothetical protein
MVLAFRPTSAGAASFPLPLTLECPAAAAPVVAAAAGEGGEQAVAAAAVAERVCALAVPVTAIGVQPLVVLSKASLDFGPCIVGRGGMQRPSSYTAEVYIRNNTDADLEVMFGPPSSEKDRGCLGVFVLDPAGPFLLAPGDDASTAVKFTPQDARWAGGGA